MKKWILSGCAIILFLTLILFTSCPNPAGSLGGDDEEEVIGETNWGTAVWGESTWTP